MTSSLRHDTHFFFNGVAWRWHTRERLAWHRPPSRPYNPSTPSIQVTAPPHQPRPTLSLPPGPNFSLGDLGPPPRTCTHTETLKLMWSRGACHPLTHFLTSVTRVLVSLPSSCLFFSLLLLPSLFHLLIIFKAIHIHDKNSNNTRGEAGENQVFPLSILAARFSPL